jgi:nitrite reductase/ring-hydroxylating ferredoxin subunit
VTKLTGRIVTVPIGKAGEIVEGMQKFVKLDGKGIYVSRVHGELFAADSACPCPLSGGALNRIVELDGAPCVECDAKCYTLAFDLRTGRNVRGFGFEVEVHPTRVEGGEVFVEMKEGAAGVQ